MRFPYRIKRLTVSPTDRAIALPKESPPEARSREGKALLGFLMLATTTPASFRALACLSSRYFPRRGENVFVVVDLRPSPLNRLRGKEEISLKMQMCCDRSRRGFPPLSELLCYGGGSCGGYVETRREEHARLLSLRAALRIRPPSLSPDWLSGYPLRSLAWDGGRGLCWWCTNAVEGDALKYEQEYNLLPKEYSSCRRRVLSLGQLCTAVAFP